MLAMQIDSGSVERHWLSRKSRSVGQLIRCALIKAGEDPDSIGRAEFDLLSPIDEFHCLGPASTIDLARHLGVERDAHVLDVGSGIGGPSRRLAICYGCRVTGLDLTKEHYEVSKNLAERMKLGPHEVDYHHGDGLDMPFESASFDFVWIQVTSTNIANRERLYSEMYRVLKPSGRLGVFDIFAGTGPIHFPVPWAYDESTNSLLSPEQTDQVLEKAGLHVIKRYDVTDRALRWFWDQTKTTLRPGGPPALGFHVLLPDWALMAYNQTRNLFQKRIFVGYRVAERM